MKLRIEIILVFAIASITSCGRHYSLDDQIFIAAGGTNTQVVSHLIERGANVNMISTKLAKHTPLMSAAQFGSYDMVRLLLSRGANPNSCDGTGNSVLFYAMVLRNDNSNIVQLLVKSGAHFSGQEEQEFVAGLPDSQNKRAYESAGKSK